MMSANQADRYPARRQPRHDDDLLLDRPAPQDLRPIREAESAPANVHDAARPIIFQPAPRPRSALDTVSRGIGLLLRLTMLLILGAVLWGVVSFVGAGMRAPAAIGEGIGNAIERGAGVAAAAAQRVTDTFDPAHPPRQALAQDAEIDELLRLNIGGEIQGSTTRSITLASIQRRAEPTGQDSAIYAVLHSELRQPQETKVLGVTVRSTRDPQDHYLYKGETVRIGARLYKVNWVSMERQQLALVAYREQDRVAAPLKAQVD
ncbi:MAG: hypothetical protein IT306_03680 [Chloroflexi bacterium]|nr:hypothetical protein [Chloroflexota bacterium]